MRPTSRPPGQPRPLWIVWRLLLHRPGLFAAHATYITAMAYALPLVPGLVVRELLDRLTGEAPLGPDVSTLIAVLAGVVVAEFVGRVAGPFVVVTLRQHAEVLLRRNLLVRVLERPGARALPSSPGDALVRFTKDPEEVSHALDFLGDPIGQVVGVTFAMVLLGSIDAFLTATIVVPATLVMLGARFAGRRIAEARRSRQQALGGVSGLLGDAFTGVSAVQAAGAEDRVTTRLVELGEERRRATLRDLVVDQAVLSFSTNTATLATGVLLLVAASDARSGRLTAGDLALFTSYLRWLATVVGFVGHVMTTLRQADVSVERMGEVLQAPAAGVVAHRPTHLRGPLPRADPAVPSPALRRLEHLEVDGLTFTHPSSGRGIAGASLEVRVGELVVITGRVGSGKTTLLRALLGLLPPDAGLVRWNGEVVPDPGVFFVPPRAAYTAQVPKLFSASLQENVLLGLDADDEALAAAAHTAVLDRDLADLGAGWETPVGSRGVMLSGGQVQRAAAARMFVRSADLVVLDDLSSALDVETEEELWQRLLTRVEATYLIVTHRRAVLQQAHRVVVLREGRVDGVGTLEVLLRTNAEMRSLWRSER